LLPEVRPKEGSNSKLPRERCDRKMHRGTPAWSACLPPHKRASEDSRGALFRSRKVREVRRRPPQKGRAKKNHASGRKIQPTNMAAREAASPPAHLTSGTFA